MTDDITTDVSGNADPVKKQNQGESKFHPIEGVVLLTQAANRKQDGRSRWVKQAAIRVRVLRRMLENSLEREAPVKRPHLKIVK